MLTFKKLWTDQSKGRLAVFSTLAAIAIGAFLFWSYSFFDILQTDDGLIVEKLTLLVLLLCHLKSWAKPVRYTPSLPKIILLSVTALVSILGFLTLKLSLVSISYIVFVATLFTLFTPRKNYREPCIMVMTMLALTIPGWMISRFFDFSLQQIAALQATKLLKLLYPAVKLSGFTIELDHHFINIAESCDGSSFLRLSIAVALYCGMTTYSKTIIALRVIAASLMALLLNWLRIVFLGVLCVHGYHDFAFESGHKLIGHITFALGIFPIIWFSSVTTQWNGFFDWLLDLGRRRWSVPLLYWRDRMK